MARKTRTQSQPCPGSWKPQVHGWRGRGTPQSYDGVPSISPLCSRGDLASRTTFCCCCPVARETKQPLSLPTRRLLLLWPWRDRGRLSFSPCARETTRPLGSSQCLAPIRGPCHRPLQWCPMPRTTLSPSTRTRWMLRQDPFRLLTHPSRWQPLSRTSLMASFPADRRHLQAPRGLRQRPRTRPRLQQQRKWTKATSMCCGRRKPLMLFWRSTLSASSRRTPHGAATARS
mmetsp:Transcript_6308/g.18453  ORF Transcript_6308/g.18453 Transcript_6308/m.18453 type:complete len:230 (+) Transcript_6308:892-1581(+)